MIITVQRPVLPRVTFAIRLSLAGAVLALLFATGLAAPRLTAAAAPAAPYLVGAAILIADPLLGNGRPALALEIGFGLAGLARLSVALASDRAGRGWLHVSRSTTIAVALAIAFGWPFTEVTPMVKVMALDLLVLGVALILAHTGRDGGSVRRERRGPSTSPRHRRWLVRSAPWAADMAVAATNSFVMPRYWAMPSPRAMDTSDDRALHCWRQGVQQAAAPALTMARCGAFRGGVAPRSRP